MEDNDITVETTAVVDDQVATQETGLCDIAPAPTSQTDAPARKPFAPNPTYLAMAKKLRGA